MDSNYFFAVSVVMLNLQLSFIHTATFLHNCNNISHISHTTIETAKKTQLSSINTTTFFHNCNNFFNSFIIYGQRFPRRIFLKKLLLFQLECVKEPLAILCPKDQWFGVKYSVVLHFTNMFI